MPFGYRAKVARPKRRTNDRVVLAGRVPVLPERLSFADAPIAAQAGDEIFRYRDGAWLRPVRLPSGDVAMLAELGHLIDRPNHGANSWVDYPLYDLRAGLPYLPFADGVEFEDALPSDWTVKSSERGVREGFARAASASLVDVEGVLWRACPEPFLVMRAGGRGVSGDLVIEVALHPDPENDCAFFPLDRVDEAQAHAEVIATAFNKRRPLVPEVEVRAKSILKFDPAPAMAERISWALEAKRRRAWLNPADLKKDPAGPDMTRILAAVDQHVAGGDPFPVLAATSALFLSERRDGRYGAFLRKGFLQIAEPQLMRWAAAYGGSLAMSVEEDAAVAGIGAP
jgi:hypothetical protein